MLSTILFCVTVVLAIFIHVMQVKQKKFNESEQWKPYIKMGVVKQFPFKTFNVVFYILIVTTVLTASSGF
jgi:hypothetical protein